MKIIYLLFIFGISSFPTLTFSQNVGRCVVNFKTGWRQNYTQIDCAISQPRPGSIRVEGNLRSTTGGNMEYYLEIYKNSRTGKITSKVQLKDNARKKSIVFNLDSSNAELAFGNKTGPNNPFDFRFKTKKKLGSGGDTLDAGSLIFVDGEFLGKPL